MLLMIDNYDSFTFNLVQYFQELGQKVVVHTNDSISIAGLSALSPQYLVISPGPCTPNEAGVSMAAIQYFSGRIPILGICLGHQCIGQVFGAQVIRAQQPMHGRVSAIHHHQQGVFTGLPSPFTATRYHSLVLAKDSLPDCLEVTAQSPSNSSINDEIMAIRHKNYSIEGVQFHPESILSQHGHQLLHNFLQQT